jgi:hypothetical protein
MTTATPNFRRRLRTGLIAAALAGVLGTAVFGPAFADERWQGGWHEHGRRDRDWHDHDGWRAPYVYAAPGYYVAPGYGYGYAPAPAYLAPPALNFGVTIR